ncbi:MAG: asparagine synthase (glutamine-hydrolyzing) [Patescibacteria group bacterium]
MCGISGFNWEDKNKVETMVQVLSHRGPDAKGVFVGEGISLGHNRLSVIDLSPTANQPMHDNSGELAIVFNGEIYNFRELKMELGGSYEFKTKSDTEVILAGYLKWGRRVTDKLNGMFAFAIWDRRTKELFCARDHAGIKPFYYYFDGSKFIFASEVKAILEHDVPRKLSKEAFNQYLRVLYVPEPMTMIQNIFKLPPKGMLVLKDGKLSLSTYGDWQVAPSPSSYEEATRLLKDKVISSVGRQLVSDVPVGLYLSGGIDSSSVLAAMTRHSQNIETFSVGFELEAGEESDKFNQDFDLATKTAAFFGAKHNGLRLSAKDILTSLEEAAADCDDPVSNPTSVAMLRLAKFAKTKVTVVLNGSGGDELFGGYDRYRFALAANYFKKLPEFLKSVLAIHPKLKKFNYETNVDLFAKFMFQKDDRLSSVISPSLFESDTSVKKYFGDKYFSKPAEDAAESLMWADKESWLPEYFFMLSDKMSMAGSLEERMPLTDRELVAFAGSLPRNYKLDIFRTKKILKDAFKSELPSFLFREPKRGWFSPGAKWLRRPEFTSFAKEVLSESYYAGTKDIFNWPEVMEMLSLHVSKERYNLTLLWSLLTFQLWAKRYRVEL